MIDKLTNKKETIESDICLLSTGRVPSTKNLGLENIGVQLDKFGKIPVD
jgi:dihydrolipoamide dehydrogenase